MTGVPGSSGSSRARVLRVIARMNVGGPAYHVALLSGRLDPDRYETLLVAGRTGPGEASFLQAADRYGARYEVLDALGPELDPVADVRALAGLVRIARRFRPHIVDTHTAKAGVLGRLAAQAVRPRPVVVHTYHGHVLRGYFGPPRTALYRMLERAMALVTDRLIGVSRATVEELARLGVAPRRRFEVVPLGLELEPLLTLDPQVGRPFRDEIGVGEGELLLVYMGRLVPIKRLDVLLRAVAHARQAGAPLRLALVGDGPERASLEALSRSLGLAEAVVLTGYRLDVPTVVAAADVGVLTSDNEGTPVSLIELAAGGRPLVATAVGGVREVVADGCGVLVPAGDHASFGEALVRLAAEPEARRARGRAAREHVRTRYTAERLLRDVDALYQRLLVSRYPLERRADAAAGPAHVRMGGGGRG
jgi:glycosyltransferase involved in cell wall biosynthesis